MHTGKGQASVMVGGIMEDITDIGGGSPLVLCPGTVLFIFLYFTHVNLFSATHGDSQA